MRRLHAMENDSQGGSQSSLAKRGSSSHGNRPDAAFNFSVGRRISRVPIAGKYSMAQATSFLRKSLDGMRQTLVGPSSRSSRFGVGEYSPDVGSDRRLQADGMRDVDPQGTASLTKAKGNAHGFGNMPESASTAASAQRKVNSPPAVAHMAIGKKCLLAGAIEDWLLLRGGRVDLIVAKTYRKHVRLSSGAIKTLQAKITKISLVRSPPIPPYWVYDIYFSRPGDKKPTRLTLTVKLYRVTHKPSGQMRIVAVANLYAWYGLGWSYKIWDWQGLFHQAKCRFEAPPKPLYV